METVVENAIRSGFVIRTLDCIYRSRNVIIRLDIILRYGYAVGRYINRLINRSIKQRFGFKRIHI